jgi:hypothetical protein
LILERCYDVRTCWFVCKKIWDEISEDNAPDFVPDVWGEYWIGVYENDELSGMYRIHQLNGVTYQLHALMIERANAKESGRMILRWCADNIEDMQKIIAEIPVIYPNVYHFALGQGLQDEGLNRASFLKRGEIHDAHRLGITRGEIWEQR